MVLAKFAKSFLVRRTLNSIALIREVHHKPFYQCYTMSVKKALEEFEVYPDVVKSLPQELIEVKYTSNSSIYEVKLGNELKPTDVRNFPTHLSFPFKEGKFYTVCMTDPDAPSRKSPTFREWEHFLAVNVVGNRVNEADILAEYVGSGPPPGTGLHRYVWVVYEQLDGKINPTEKRLTNRSGEGRAKFSIENFAKKYNLGNPVAANFYQAEYDDYVPELYKQLGEA